MSDIKIKVGVDLDLDTGKMQSQLKALEKDLKLKIKVDEKAFSDIRNNLGKAKSQIEKDDIKLKINDAQAMKSLGNVQNKFKNLKDVEIKTTMKGNDLDKMVVKYKEADGITKSIYYTMNKDTKFLEQSKVVEFNKGMEKLNGLTKEDIQNKDRLLAAEKKLNGLREKSYKLDKNSSEFKVIEQDIKRLDGTTSKYKENLKGISQVQLKGLSSDLKELDVQMDKSYKKQQRIARESIDFNKVGQGMESAGRGIMAFSAPIVAAGVAGIKASIDFESAFAGVNSCPLC